MLLAVSRLMFAWADDGIFPARVAEVHPRFRTPHVAVVASGVMATIGVVGSHLAGDFFLGVDILVTSMLVNFLLMAVSVLTLPRRNPALARAVTVVPSRAWQVPIGVLSMIVLIGFLVVHTWKDLSAPGGRLVFQIDLALGHRDGHRLGDLLARSAVARADAASICRHASRSCHESERHGHEQSTE